MYTMYLKWIGMMNTKRTQDERQWITMNTRHYSFCPTQIYRVLCYPHAFMSCMNVC